MSKEVHDAILAIRKSVPSITKDEENKHGGYRYVSIDQYYASVASVATAQGLVWRTRQTDFEFIPNQGKLKDRTFIKATFAYDVSKGATSIQDYMTVTVAAPFDGPQVTGVLYSYAEKVFMRVAFCVQTGEQDADAIPPERGGFAGFFPDMPPPPLDVVPPVVHPLDDNPPDDDSGDRDLMGDAEKELFPIVKGGLPIADTRKINADAVGTIEEIFKVFMPTVKNAKALRDWHTENLAAKEKVKALDPEAGERISKLFADKNKEFKK